MPTVTFCNELNDDKIGYPSYVPRATHRFTFDRFFHQRSDGKIDFETFLCSSSVMARCGGMRSAEEKEQ